MRFSLQVVEVRIIQPIIAMILDLGLIADREDAQAG
jgi:hypothetical protein